VIFIACRTAASSARPAAQPFPLALLDSQFPRERILFMSRVGADQELSHS